MIAVNRVMCATGVLLLTASATAHPGRTDSSGGHHNRKTGGYHYHGGGGGGTASGITSMFRSSARTEPRTTQRSEPRRVARTRASRTSVAIAALDDHEIVERLPRNSIPHVVVRLKNAADRLTKRRLEEIAREVSRGEHAVVEFFLPDTSVREDPWAMGVMKDGALRVHMLEFRTWTSADGKFRVEAWLKQYDGETAVLVRRDGREIEVAAERLSAEDRAYFQERLRGK